VKQSLRSLGEGADQGELIEARGPWPFTTRRTFRRSDQSLTVWESRRHRKGLGPARHTPWANIVTDLFRGLWLPRHLNWWIGVIFALGSLLFALGSVLSLDPALARSRSLDPAEANAIFFVASIPFTLAAYLQLFQAANAGTFPPRVNPARPTWVVFGWRPTNAGWLSCALQFAGTLLFNLNTFDAMLPGLDWLQQDLLIWAPDLAGSILFLASGYLAFIEAGHAHRSWRPQDLSWWITFVNLLGCIAFMVSALYAFVTPQPLGFDAAGVSVELTLVGAVAFLLGSLLMLPETAAATRKGDEGAASAL